MTSSVWWGVRGVVLTVGSLAIGGSVHAQVVRVDSLETVRVVGTLGGAIDAQLTRYAAAGFSGTVLVVRDKRIVLLKGYGMADAAGVVPNAPGTRFEMNSITKMFTGASILQLAGAGRLELDQSIEAQLGLFPDERKATIRQLAMHTAGLVQRGTTLDGTSRDAFVASIKGAPREAPPGERYRYSNAGYSLLAVVIENASAETYEDYVRTHIFAPAGMRTAIFRPQVPSGDPRFARGYVASPQGPVPGPPNPYGWGTTGAGGVWSTVGDVYRWLEFVESGNAVPARYRAVLFSPPPAPSLEAFGWHVTARTDTSRARIDKGGGSADFASQLLYYPDDRVVIVWASNDLSRRWRGTLNQALPDLIFTGTTAAGLPR